MTDNRYMKELHCDGMGGWSCCGSHGGRGYGGRPPLPIEAELAPVYGQTTVFSLPHACLAAGLLTNVEKDQPLQWSILMKLAQERWEGSPQQFLKEAEKVGVNETSIDAHAKKYKGVVIGWSGPSTGQGHPFGICPDIGTTVTVLSRRVGDLFVSSRDPDYSWQSLFGSPFEVDEHLCEAPDLKSPPWSGFKWVLLGGTYERRQ